MNFLKKYRKTILVGILFFALFLVGQEIYDVLSNGINKEKNIIIEFSGLASHFLLSVFCVWELYMGERKE